MQRYPMLGRGFLLQVCAYSGKEANREGMEWSPSQLDAILLHLQMLKSDSRVGVQMKGWSRVGSDHSVMEIGC